MPFAQIHWLAVVVGTVAFMGLGFLWYGPLFGKPWLAAMEKLGRKREDMTMSPGLIVVNVVTAFISNLVLDLVILGFGATQWWVGLIAGAVVWVGVGATAATTSSVFEGRPWALWTIFFFYELVLYAGMGVVYTVWR